MSIKKFTSFLSESQLLLEYDREKTWKQHGKKALDRAYLANSDGGDRHPILHHVAAGLDDAAARKEDPYALHTVDKHGEDVVNHHSQALLAHFEATDPSKNRKYVPHVARIYGAGGVKRLEDLHTRMKPALAKFDELSTRKIIPADQRDLGRYKSLSQLEDVIDAHADKLSGNQADKAHHEEMKKQATIVDHPEFTQITPHTTAAAQHFGKGTRWCTATEDHEDSMFNHYNEHGPMHVLIPKKPNYPGEKYQFHYGSDQFMDEKDEPVHHDDPPGVGNTAVRKFVADYKDKMDDISKTPGALNHPEKTLSKTYLSKHASHQELLDHMPKLRYDDVLDAQSNKNFGAEHIHAALDNNRDPAVRSKIYHHDMLDHDEKEAIRTKLLNDKSLDVAAHGVNYFTNRMKPEELSSLATKAIDNDHTALGSAVTYAAQTKAEDRERLFHGLSNGPYWAAQTPHTPEHLLVKAAGETDNENTAVEAVTNKNATHHVGLAAIKNPNTTAGAAFAVDRFGHDHPEILDAALEHRITHVRAEAARNQSASYNHIDKALDDSNYEVRNAAVGNLNVSSSHIDKALKDPEPKVRARAANSPAIQDHHVNHIADNETDPLVLSRLLDRRDYHDHGSSQHKVQSHHLDKIYDRRDQIGDTYPVYLLARHRKASPELLDKALDHPSASVRNGVLENPNAQPHHIDKAMSDKDRTVIATAVRHHHATREHVLSALQHDHPSVIAAALKSEKVSTREPEWDAGIERLHKLKNTPGFNINEGFKAFISEELLLEYDAKKTWKNFGDKALGHFAKNEENLDHPVASDIAHHIRNDDEKKAGKVLLKHFEDTDPTPNKQYVSHVARIYGKGGVDRFEDLHSRMKPALEKFHDLVTRKVMRAEHRDIGRLKSLSAIEDLNDAHGEKESGNQASAAEHAAMKGQATITDHPEFTHIVPHTPEAANHFGKGTRWCTTGHNGAHMFNSYNSQGPLQIMIPKKPSYAGEKYQYHYATGQFMDEKDKRAAQPTLYDRNTGRCPIGEALPKTNADVHKFISKYESDAETAKLTRAGLSHPEPKVATAALSQAHDITKEDLTTAMRGGAAKEAIKHPKADASHVDQAFAQSNAEVMAAAINNHPDKIDKYHLTAAMNAGGNAALAGIRHPLVDSSHVTQALARGGDAGIYALQNPALSREQITTALKSQDFNIRKAVLKNPAINSEDLHGAIKKDAGTAIAALDHPKIEGSHVDAALKHSDAGVKIKALNHTLADDELKDSALSSNDPRTRALMVRNGGVGMAERGIKDEHPLVRWASVYSADGEKVLHQAAHDIDPQVRLGAVMHPNAPSAVLDKGAFDNDELVNAAARGHPRAVHRGSHALIEPKYPARETVHGTNANYTHVPGHHLSDLKVDALKSFVKNHNATSSSKLSIIKKGRAGIGNPWNKTGAGRQGMKRGNVPVEHASRFDMYITKRHDYNSPRVETPEHIHKFHPKMEDNASFEIMCAKAKEVGIEVSILREVFERGLESWNEETMKTPEQYAHNRLNSFLAGGLAAKLDDDLLTELDRKTLSSYIRKAKHVVANTPEDSKVHKKSKTGIERAEKKLSEEQLDEVYHIIGKKRNGELFVSKPHNTQKSANDEHERLIRGGHVHSLKVVNLKALDEEQLDEISIAATRHYVEKAKKSVKNMEDGEYTDHNDNKVFKRKLYITFAKYRKLHKEENNVVDNSESELIERELLDTAKLLSVHRRDTKNQKVIRRYNERRHSMRDVHRTEMVLNRKFIKRKGDDNKFIDRSRHQITDRWRNQRLQRIAMIRKAANVKEGIEYIDNRQKIHDAHAESSRILAGRERDPELRRLDLHRSKKHEHASRVLDILKSKIAKKKK